MATKTMKKISAAVIPTPRCIIKLGGGNQKVYRPDMAGRIHLLGKPSSGFSFAGEFLRRNLQEEFALPFTVDESAKPAAKSIVICNTPALLAKGLLNAEDLAVFAKKNAREQGYIIRSEKDKPVILCAMSDAGCQYAVATLLQLFHASDGAVLLDNVVVRDYPDFQYRGNCWLIAAELGVWSYDRGDGLKAYKKRIIEKLDLALKYKINVLIFDGIGWNPEKFTGYGSFMREINQQARLRGIHLMYVGCGAGYGPAGRSGLYTSQAFKNRQSYPDGKEYLCLGGVSTEGDISNRERGRYHGTCLSNNALMKLKQAELKKFVAAVEPGALYIHNLDNDKIQKEMWQRRCLACRKRWPNDEVAAKDGMAGAFAYHYDCLAEAVKSVKKPGYDADKDCLIMMVSPGYEVPEHPDEEWNIALKYWPAVSRFMKYKENIFLTLREQFFNHENNQMRWPQMQAAVQKDGHGHALGNIYFYGADGAYNDQLFISSPALNYMQKGADMLVMASGHAYQEPLQLLNAEYLWNADHSGFYNIKEKPRNYQEFQKLFVACRNAKTRPGKLYGKGGFLELACEKLYGKTAGPAMEKFFYLRGKNGEPAVPYIMNMELDAGFWPYPYRWIWQNKLSVKELVETKTRYTQIIKINRKARMILEKLSKKKELAGNSKTEIHWYLSSLKTGSEYVTLLSAYLDIYRELDNYLNRKADAREKRRLGFAIAKLKGKVTFSQNRWKNSGLVTIDYLGGALAGRKEVLDVLAENLAEMAWSLENNRRLPDKLKEYNPWW